MTDDIKLANPAVLGLTCFGLTTLLLNLHNAGLFKMDTTILGLGLFVGGLAQVIAGILEFRKGNTFAMTAFIAYGTFWISLVFAIMYKGHMAFNKPLFAALAYEPSLRGLAYYMLLWGVFTAFMLVATFRINRVLQFVFATLLVLFIMLAIGFGWANPNVIKAAGIVGIFTGAAAVYLAMAENLEEIYGKTILPFWPYKANGNYKENPSEDL
ncbi:MAG TPA: acetate uptake transporter [Candidatus Anoxymicrobiaceae bacterium]|jgi:succinate-acetate transporter protein